MPDRKSLSIERSGPVSGKGFILPGGAPLLRKRQDFFRVRRRSVGSLAGSRIWRQHTR